MRNKLAIHVADISRCPRQVRDPHVEPRNGGLSPENPSQVGTRGVIIVNMVIIFIRIIVVMVGWPLKTLHITPLLLKRSQYSSASISSSS